MVEITSDAWSDRRSQTLVSEAEGSLPRGGFVSPTPSLRAVVVSE
jgi:hypothetical protein